jgi:hypothetical protein
MAAQMAVASNFLFIWNTPWQAAAAHMATFPYDATGDLPHFAPGCGTALRGLAIPSTS